MPAAAPKGETCETCRFWERGKGEASGECHRHPPQQPLLVAAADLTTPAMIGRATLWLPTTDAGQWCGEWRKAGDKGK